jgi:invasion protein IalB
MRASVPYVAIAVIAADLFAAPATSGEARSSALIYSPWTKYCIDTLGQCFIGADAQDPGGCGPVFSAVLIEHSGEAKRTLRVTVPGSANRASGVRVGIDQDTPTARPYAGCYRNAFGRDACMADIEAGAELVGRLGRGQWLVLTATNAAGAPVSMALPLAGFAASYAAPPPVPPTFRVVSHEEMLAIEAQQAREKAERDARCGTK